MINIYISLNPKYKTHVRSKVFKRSIILGYSYVSIFPIFAYIHHTHTCTRVKSKDDSKTEHDSKRIAHPNVSKGWKKDYKTTSIPHHTAAKQCIQRLLSTRKHYATLAKQLPIPPTNNTRR